MTTYSLNKRSYFLFQDSASKVSYACERIILNMNMKMNMNKMANFIFG